MKSRVINIRKEDAALYPVFGSWWESHGWNAVQRERLPPSGVLIESDDGKPLAASWLYLACGVDFAMMEWTVTNPEASARESYVAIAMLVQAIREVASSLSYSVVMTAARQSSLVRCYEKNGFLKSDEGMTHLILFTKD